MQKSVAADHSVGLQPLQSLGKIDKIFSRSSFQSLSTTRDILEYGPQSPLTESLDSNRSSGVEAFIDQSGASSVLALDGGIHDDRHNLDHQSLQAGLERLAVSPQFPLNRLPTEQNGRDNFANVNQTEVRSFPHDITRQAYPTMPFHELTSPSRTFHGRGQRGRACRSPQSPASYPNGNVLGKTGAYRQLFEDVIKIGGVPEELTVENLVPKILALKKDESPIPIIEPGLPYMDGRAVAYLLKDLTKHDKVDRAMEIFQWLRKQYPNAEYNHLYDVYFYTTGIKLCGMRQALADAICLVAEMKSRGIACNIHTYSSLMNTCIKCGQYSTAEDVYKAIRREGCEPNVVTYNTLVDLYGKLGRWQDAVGVIDQVIRSGLRPEVRTYNTAIIAANVCNQPQEALKVYHRMLRDGFEPIDTTYTALISAHGKNGDLESACRTYEAMIRQGLPCNIITYGSLIQAAEQRGKWQLALWFSDRMQHDDIMPNTMTFNALLSACAQGAESQRAEILFNNMISRRLKPDAGAYSALILAHVRAGHWRAALQAWELMHVSSAKADPSLYSSLIQCLWESGAPLARAQAARLFTLGCRSQAVPKCIRQFHAQNGSLQIRVSAPNISIAVLSLHRMLRDFQEKIDSESNPFIGESVELVIENVHPRVKFGETLQLDTQGALAIMLAGLGSPFSQAPANLGCMLKADGASLNEWLARTETKSCLATYIPLLTERESNERRLGLEHSRSAAEEEALNQRMAIEHQRFCQVEMGQQERQARACEWYGGCRSECLQVAKALATNCQLSMDAVYAAMTQLDSALLAQVKFEGQAELLVAACLLIVSPLVSSTANYGHLFHQLEREIRAPAGALSMAILQLRALRSSEKTFNGLPMGQNGANQIALPSVALEKYLYFLNVDSFEPGRNLLGQNDSSAMNQETSRKLLALTMVDPSAVHIRPSILAAAALAVDRKLNGITPIWPPSLQSWTGIPEFNQEDFRSAIEKITEIAEAIAFGHQQPSLLQKQNSQGSSENFSNVIHASPSLASSNFNFPRLN